jgi:hypothetical protein
MKKILLATFLFLVGCTTIDSTLTLDQNTKLADRKQVRTVRTCGRYIFGSFTLPYFGDTGIKYAGEESIMGAVEQGGFKKVYGVDKVAKRYFLFSSKCIVVFGE